MKKNTTTAQAQAQAQEQEHAPVTRSKSKSKAQKPATAPDSSPALPDVLIDKAGMHFVIPSFVPASKWDATNKVIFTGYTFSTSPAVSAGAKNTIISPALASAVQVLLFADAIDNTAGTLTALDKAPEEETEEARKVRKLSLTSLRGAIEEARKACPASATVDSAYREKNPHAVLLASVIGGHRLPVDWSVWFKHCRSMEEVLDSIVLDALSKGTATMTDGQRATITAGKVAVAEMFKPFTEAGEHSRAFNLRVKDADIVQWYKLSGAGYTKKGAFRSALNPKHPENSPLAGRLTAWLFGKISREYTEQ